MASKTQSQRGGFFLGMVVGLLAGLVLALGVALYVNKVPIPFIDKVPQRTADQDAAEAAKNKDWNPNAPLVGKSPALPASAAASTAAPAPAVPTAQGSASAVAPAPAASKPVPDVTQFFVQVGAYARSEDAEQQRAKLGLSGMVGRISEREQAGKLIYRVRLGPFDTREDADAIRQQVAEAGYPDATLVRVQPQN